MKSNTITENVLLESFPEATREVYDAGEKFSFRAGTDEYDHRVEAARESVREAGSYLYQAAIKEQWALQEVYFGFPTEETPDRSPRSTEKIAEDALTDVETAAEYLEDCMLIFEDIIEKAEENHGGELDEVREGLSRAEDSYKEAVQQLGYGLMELKEGIGTRNLGPEYEPVFTEV